MITNILYTVCSMLIEVTIIFTIINCMTSKPETYLVKQILFSIPYNIISSIVFCYMNIEYSYLINLVFLFLLTYFFVKETLLNTFIIYLFSYSIAAVMQLLILPVILVLHIDTNTFGGASFANLCSLLLTCLMCHFLPFSRLYSLLIIRDTILKIVTVNSFIIITAIVLYYKIDATNFIQSFIIISASIILLIFINSELFVSHHRYQQQKSQLQAYIDYIPLIDGLISQIRETQHDHNNHIQAIQMLPLTHTDYESLSSALLSQTTYMASSSHSSELLKLNLKLVCGLLINKYSEAASQKKHLQINIENFNLQTVVPEYELIDIIGILTDNSIEATSIGETSMLSIGSSQNKVTITTKNIGPLVNDDLCTHMFKNGYTTKSPEANTRGIGLYKLKKIIDSYGGKLILSNETDSNDTYIIFEIIV